MVASAVVHLAVGAIVLLYLLLSGEPPQRAQPGIDTRTHDLTLHFDFAVTELPSIVGPTHVEPPPPAATPIQPKPAETARPPFIRPVPSVLPAQALTLIRRPQPASVPTSPATTVTDPNVRPASTTSSTSPLHGAMSAGQTVVYVLDCSGSMGEFGKLAKARAALVATLHQQSEGVRFQIIAYNSTARALLPGGLLPANAINLATAETRLAPLAASGQSNHVEAVRFAAGLRPDVIVLLTDAGDLSATKLKPAFNGTGKAVPLYLVRVAAEQIGSPKELR